jgi:hypothetical protein
MKDRKHKSYKDVAEGRPYFSIYVEYSHRVVFIKYSYGWTGNLIYVTQDAVYSELFYNIHPLATDTSYEKLQDAVTETLLFFVGIGTMEYRRDKIRMSHEDV